MKYIHTIYNNPAAHQNALISVLSAGISDRVASHLRLVDLPAGAVLHQAERAEGFAYFPNDAVISLLSMIKNGKSAEIAVIGNEGMVGIDALAGGTNPCNQAKVQCAGTAYRVPTRLLRDEFNRHGETRWLILRYMQSLFAQISQAVICNRHHSIEQQLCRKLLTSSDQLCSSELAMTQSTIAELLGVRREGITAAAGELKQRGVIEYRRGRIRILDRAKLEAQSCECYAVVKRQCDRLRPAESVTDSHQRIPSPATVRPVQVAVGRRGLLGNAAA